MTPPIKINHDGPAKRALAFDPWKWGWAALGFGAALLAAVAVAQNTRLPNSCYDETGTMQLYDPACCCTSGWCAPLDDAWVTKTATGWRITVPPGGHPRLLPGVYEVRTENAKRSPDGRFHACGFFTVRCFLAAEWWG